MTLELIIEDTFTYREGKMKCKIEGEKEGEKKKRDKVILAMLKKGKYGHEEIAKIAEVSVKYVQDLHKMSS